MKDAEETKMNIRKFMTAGRKGSKRTKANYVSNAIYLVSMMLLYYAVWALFRQYAFPDFSPFSYWNLAGGNLWQNILVAGAPMILYALFNGFMDLFNNESDYGTIQAESIGFKSFVALSAGVIEELTHRGVLIWFGLVLIWLDNKFLIWVIGLIIIIFVLAAIKTDILVGIMALILSGVLLYLIKDIENPIYLLNGLTLSFYELIADYFYAIYVIYVVIMTVVIIETRRGIRQGKMRKNISMKGLLPGIIGLTAMVTWAGYAIPKGVLALNNMPFLPPGADHWTFLLYVGAVIWTNVLFRKGHKYQGILGVIHSYVSGFYLIYVAFTFGLLYAIIVHFLYDLLVFGSEHAAHLIKNSRNVRTESECEI